MRRPARVRSSNTGLRPCGTNPATPARTVFQPSRPIVSLPACISVMETSAPLTASTTRVSPATHFPRQTVSTLRGIRKYSTVRANANEFGGMMQTSPVKSTNDFSSKFFGSTIVELMLVKILNSLEQRMS